MNRLRTLFDELEVDDSTDVTIDPATTIGSRDPFFTAEVIAALPERLAFTGLTPRQRVALLGLFHGLAVAASLGIVWTFAPGSVGVLAQHAHGWLEAGGELSWTWGLAAVVLVGLVALAATRSHTRPA